MAEGKLNMVNGKCMMVNVKNYSFHHTSIIKHHTQKYLFGVYMFTKKLLYLIIFVVFLVIQLNGQSNKKEEIKATNKPKITFIELGSVNCIPCKAMQPIMKSVEKKYSDQLKVVFYDVWKEDQQQYAEKYGIRLIPTQVFLDDKGKEIFRHEGFFAEAELDKFLQSKGLKIKVADEKK